MQGTRHGKIASFPRAVRDQLNQRLDDGQHGTALLQWLNELPEVKAVLDAHYAGQPVSAQNLSVWRHNGYPDWCQQQETAHLMRTMAEEDDTLHTIDQEILADRSSLWLTARYLLIGRKLAREAGSLGFPEMRELNHKLATLRRGEHNARRLKLVERRLDLEQRQSEAGQEELFEEWRKQRGYHKPLTAQEQKERLKRIFGLPDDYQTPEERGVFYDPVTQKAFFIKRNPDGTVQTVPTLADLEGPASPAPASDREPSSACSIQEDSL